MNTRTTALFALLCTTLISACNTPVDQFVEQTVETKLGTQATMHGQVNFTHTTYFTAYRTECDRVVCGYDQEYRCDTVTRCHSPLGALDASSLELASLGLSDIALDRPHPRDPGHPPPRGPVDRDPPGGGGGRPHPRDPGDHDRDRCYTERVCGYESVPRYCDTNCREVPYTDSRTQQMGSPVIIKLVGISDEDLKKVKSLNLGVKTNDKFQEAIRNIKKAPKKLRDAFKNLKAEDRTLVVLVAKGYRLREGQDFLRLADNFKAGDQVMIELQVEPTGGSKEVHSALGSTVDFPALHTSTQE